MSIAATIWNRTLKKPYHFLMPRFRIRKKINGLIYVINLNDHLSFLHYKGEQEVKAILSRQWGLVWDVGCNFGLYSILSAHNGNRVVSFDLSLLALSYLKQSAALNNLTVNTVDRPLTPAPEPFSRPRSADCTNSVFKSDGTDTETSMTYTEAARLYGTPDLIKMDIEGGEEAFFQDTAFLAWLTENRISLLVELHNGFDPADTALPGATVTVLDSSHRLYSFRD